LLLLSLISGLTALYAINPKTAMFAAISMFLYTSVYTPLKTKTPLAVFVGAFPGAIPFMLGWVAATGSFGLEAGTLFMIQFFWQFPHFWAIGWLMFEDYNRVGINMLPSGKRDRKTALQAVLYSVWTLVTFRIPSVGDYGLITNFTCRSDFGCIIRARAYYFCHAFVSKTRPSIGKTADDRQCDLHLMDSDYLCN
jgi:protoheme IX farnesyltransferase